MQAKVQVFPKRADSSIQEINSLKYNEGAGEGSFYWLGCGTEEVDDVVMEAVLQTAKGKVLVRGITSDTRANVDRGNAESRGGELVLQLNGAHVEGRSSDWEDAGKYWGLLCQLINGQQI